MRVKKMNLLEDWDWLIILDACRYDIFKILVYQDKFYRELNFKLEPRISYGSCTLEFLNNMPRLKDSICITGHPFVLQFKHKFTRVIDVGFDYDWDTVLPRRIIDYVINHMSEIAKYKRKVLWFLQPHHPFHHPPLQGPKLWVRIYENSKRKIMTPMLKQIIMYKVAWKAGYLKKAYTLNLKWILEELKKIIPYLAGKIVITSDHGDGLGSPISPNDKPVFSHPCNRQELELLLVPWCVIVKK